jgi:hypothetical protein
VIEGEGLGGFARRVTVNESAEGLFRPARYFFTVATNPLAPLSLGEANEPSPFIDRSGPP